MAIALLLVTLSVTGCDPGTTTSTGEPPNGDFVHGVVSLTQPLKGVPVRFLSTVVASVPGLRLRGDKPGDPDIVLGPFELRAELRDFDANAQGAYVNAVTTLIARYMAIHPEFSLDRATTNVKSFLGIPDDVNVSDVLTDLPRYASFRHTPFLDEADDRGGVDAYIGQLAPLVPIVPLAIPGRVPASASSGGIGKFILSTGIRLRRDSLVSVMYAEELNSTTSSVTLQRTDRHEILGQKSPHCQMSL